MSTPAVTWERFERPRRAPAPGRRPLPAGAPAADDDVGTPEMLRAAGMTYRVLDYWTRRGALVAVNPSPGSGQQRRYPRREVPVACALVRLRAAGVPLDLAADLAREAPPAEGTRTAVRVGRGVVLCLYPDLWAVDDHPHDDDPPPGVTRIPRQGRT